MAIFSSLPHSFFFWMIFTITIAKNILAPVHGQCLEDQKTLLLELKRELTLSYFDNSQKLASWNQKLDCCWWDGVECNGVGHVISLQLNDQIFTGGLNESSSLFRLRYLEKLNLVYNFFTTGSQKIPRAIHLLTHLTHLNLSHAGFEGQVPIELSLLRRLVVLDISTWFDQTLEIPNLKMLIRNLTNLREVYLDGVDISGAGSEWCQTISSSLPYLRVLSLRDCKLSGPFHPSLSQLHSLSVVRLDSNNLSTAIPDSLANFSRLTTFSCSSCSLIGSIPKMILQVPTLQDLDLSFNKLLGGTIPQFHLRSALRSIDMSDCRLVGPIPSTFANLTELVHLDLSFNLLSGSIPYFCMSKKLTYIDLSMNNLMGSLFDGHFEGLSNLTHLDLRENSLNGSIPAGTIFALPSLELLDLSHNQFSGQINEFSSIVNFSNAFSSIDLSHNKLGGGIPQSFFTLPSLLTLQLSNNHFSGKVSEFPIVNNIGFLDLSSNRLEGPIPNSFFQQQSLEFLHLSYNLFNGSFHLEKLQRFPKLKDLDLSYNNLSVDASNINSSLHGFPNLYRLGLASCNLSDIPDFIKHSNMSNLDLSNNRIEGDIPSWIWETVNNPLSQLNLSCNLLVNLQKPYHIPNSLWMLDLHSNQLQGELPSLPHYCFYVDYSNNYFHSSTPSNIIKNITNSSINFLSLANNSLSGAIPTPLCNIFGLLVLDLSFNNFSGFIPPCIVEKSTANLQVLNLRGNNINGVIPDQFIINCSLRTLDLSHNNLGGKIPKSLANCPGLEVVNVGYNNLDDNFPCMLSPRLHVLVLRSNKFHGEWRCDKSWPNLQIVDISSNNFSGSLHLLNFSTWRGMMLQSDAHLRPNRSVSNLLGGDIFYYKDEVTLTVKGIVVNLVKIWPDFTSIDLSCNHFHGGIPDEVGNLSSLYLLNLSHNALTASIPKSLGALTELGSLDLSFNQLRGRIPEELARLTFLSILNLSYNELVGMIPIGPQFQTFSADSFEGNTGLCGFPLNTSCSSIDGNGSRPPKEKDEDEEEIEWEYVCAAVGYVVGLGSIVWILLFWRRFRETYFDKIEEVAENILDRRDHRRRRRRHGRTSVARRNEIYNLLLVFCLNGDV